MRAPLHATTAGRVEARIHAGEWAPGDRLPPERELCRDLDVSRATLRQALAELAQRGLISRHQGRGTFVVRPRVQADLAGFFSYRDALRARGMQLTTRVVSVAVVEADRAIAAELGILPGDPVVHLEWIRAVQAEALILESSNLPAACFPGLETRDLAVRSLYEVLLEDYACRVETAVETLEPVILTPREAQMLGVPRNTPALMIRRVASDTRGRTVEHTQALLRGDRTRFLLERRIRESPPAGEERTLAEVALAAPSPALAPRRGAARAGAADTA
jgi:GntR family transcriptional regulator